MGKRTNPEPIAGHEARALPASMLSNENKSKEVPVVPAEQAPNRDIRYPTNSRAIVQRAANAPDTGAVYGLIEFLASTRERMVVCKDTNRYGRSLLDQLALIGQLDLYLVNDGFSTFGVRRSVPLSDFRSHFTAKLGTCLVKNSQRKEGEQ